MKQKQWHRGQIDSFLARGGDIKSVDRFLLRGGRIKTPKAQTSDIPATDFVFGAAYNDYIDSGEQIGGETWVFMGGRCPSLDDYDGNGSEWFYENWRGRDET